LVSKRQRAPSEIGLRSKANNMRNSLPQYYNFDNIGLTSGPASIVGPRFRGDEHTVKVGLNYRFNLGGPVVARY
jgi:hypothetical protein